MRAPGIGREPPNWSTTVCDFTAFRVMLLTRYQQHSPYPLRWWELPAYGAAFALYVYMWAVASILAWFRLIRGRVGWAKTSRVRGEAAGR